MIQFPTVMKLSAPWWKLYDLSLRVAEWAGDMALDAEFDERTGGMQGTEDDDA